MILTSDLLVRRHIAWTGIRPVPRALDSVSVYTPESAEIGPVHGAAAAQAGQTCRNG